MADLALMTPEQAARILRRVRAQCVADGDCLIWTGCVKSGNGQPQANIGPWRGVSLSRLVFAAQHGRAPQANMLVVPACGNRRCMACLAEMTRSAAQQRAAERGVYSHPVAVANRTAALRRRSRYSDELIERARTMPGTCVQAAQETGISKSYVRTLRAGLCRVPDVGVWKGLVA